MITNDKLPDIAKRWWSYGSPGAIYVDKPTGVDELPAEWKAKLGGIAFPTPIVAEVENVLLSGTGLVGIKEGDIILDTTYAGRVDAWERNYPYFLDAMRKVDAPAETIGCAFSAITTWSGNYFHWILEILPRFEGLFVYEEKTGIFPNIIIEKNPPSWKMESLEMLGVTDYLIFADKPGYYVDRLVIPTTKRTRGYLDTMSVAWLRKHLRSKERVFTNPYIYITRRYASKRRVNNETELTDYLQGEGFRVVAMENASLEEQISTMRGAKCVISPHGSGLANIVFTRERTKVIELVTPDYTNPCCWLAGEAAGHKYGYVVGKPEEGENMTIDIGKLEKVMEAMDEEI